MKKITKETIAMASYDKVNWILSIDIGINGYMVLFKSDAEKLEALAVHKIISKNHDPFVFHKNAELNSIGKSTGSIKNQIDYLQNLEKLEELLKINKLKKEKGIIFIEQLTPRPIHSRASIFSLAQSYGIIKAICEQTVKHNYICIPPATWKKALNVTREKDTSLEAYTEVAYGANVTKVKELVNLPKSHDLVEAFLIGFFGHTEILKRKTK